MIPIFALVCLLLAAPDGSTPAHYPDPDRFAADIEAFVAADVTSPPPAGALLCIGSSSMRMWHDTIARDLAPAVVIPRGFGGSTMYDVLYFAPRIVVPCAPAAILLYEGDNDIDFGVAPAGVGKVFGALVALVHAKLPHTRLYVLSIKPSLARWHEWPQVQAANALLQDACAADPLLTYIDVAGPMLGSDGKPRPDIFLPDGLHMNEKGYAIWTRVVQPIVNGVREPE